jgi:hypothetical protein
MSVTGPKGSSVKSLPAHALHSRMTVLVHCTDIGAYTLVVSRRQHESCNFLR